jgi:hypothetical protein
VIFKIGASDRRQSLLPEMIGQRLEKQFRGDRISHSGHFLFTDALSRKDPLLLILARQVGKRHPLGGDQDRPAPLVDNQQFFVKTAGDSVPQKIPQSP